VESGHLDEWKDEEEDEENEEDLEDECVMSWFDRRRNAFNTSVRLSKGALVSEPATYQHRFVRATRVRRELSS